jgi:hypothetical protein
MHKWLLTLVLGLLLSGLLSPWLRRMGMGRLPGDFEFRGRHGPYVLCARHGRTLGGESPPAS